MLTYISLFSGVGGFDLGFDRAGMACLAQVEFNPKASDVLAYHWPNVKRFKDVRNVGKHNLATPDVLCGGFPCQDVSVAGKRAGLDGERSGLWFEYLRIVQELKPRFVIIENVPGLLSSNKGADFAVILRGLAECGYCVAYRILDSKYFGVAQRRRRVFIVASLGNGSAAQILFEPTGGARDTEPGRTAGKAVTVNIIEGTAIGNGSKNSQIAKNLTPHTIVPGEIPSVSGTLAASGAGMDRASGQENELDFLIPFRERGFSDYAQDNTASPIRERSYKDATDLIAQAVDVRSLKLGSEISGTLQAKKSGGWSLNYINPIVYGLTAECNASENLVGALMQPSISGGGHPAMVGVHAATGEAISPPLMGNGHDAGEDGRGRHAFAVNDYNVRRLTPVECERLQGFLDGHTAVNKQSDSARYKQMGNAVTVNVAEWIGQRIVAVEWARLSGLAVNS